MKANVFEMLIKLTAIYAVSSFVFLSAAEIPLSDKPSQEIEVTTALAPKLNETIASNDTKTETSTIAPTKTSENASVEGSGDETRAPPDVFPGEIKPANNKTLLEILQNSTSQGVKSSEETKLLNATTSTPTAEAISVSSTISSTDVTTPALNETSEIISNSSTTEAQEEDYDQLDEENGKNEAENIQEGTDQLQEGIEEQFDRNGSSQATINVFNDQATSKPLHSGHIALIFASTLVVLSVVAYIGLILWRSRLESRYGMRQRLVTEDVFYSDNQNDTRYFGL